MTLLAVCLITTESYSSDIPVQFLLKFILIFVVIVNCVNKLLLFFTIISWLDPVASLVRGMGGDGHGSEAACHGSIESGKIMHGFA